MWTRYRSQGSITRTTGYQNVTLTCAGVSTPTAQSGHWDGVAEACYDNVIPQFHSRKAKGEIFNNYFYKVKQTSSGGGQGPKLQYNGKCDSQTGGTKSIDYVVSRRNRDAWQFPLSRDAEGRQTGVPLTLIDSSNLLRLANTAALADVDASTATGLVTLGELQKTLQTLRNPVSALQRYTQGWANSRSVKQAISRNSATRALSDQYLGYYYGILPMVMDVKNILDAYVKWANNPPRSTARGQQTATESQTIESGGQPATCGSSSWFLDRLTRSEECTVRSGILYVPTEADLQKVGGLNLSDVPAAIWELTPWSFFIDYFTNLGDFIGAVSPKVGVRYLAAWETVRKKITIRQETLASGVYSCNGLTVHSRMGTEWASVTYESTERIPRHPYAGIGFGYKLNPGDWATAKQLAVTCLAISTTHRMFGRQIARTIGTAVREVKHANRGGRYTD